MPGPLPPGVLPHSADGGCPEDLSQPGRRTPASCNTTACAAFLGGITDQNIADVKAGFQVRDCISGAHAACARLAVCVMCHGCEESFPDVQAWCSKREKQEDEKEKEKQKKTERVHRARERGRLGEMRRVARWTWRL